MREGRLAQQKTAAMLGGRHHRTLRKPARAVDNPGNFASVLSLDLTTQFFKLTVGIFRLDGALGLFLRILMRKTSIDARSSSLLIGALIPLVGFAVTPLHRLTIVMTFIAGSRTVMWTHIPTLATEASSLMMPTRNAFALRGAMLTRFVLIIGNITVLICATFIGIPMIFSRFVSQLRTSLSLLLTTLSVAFQRSHSALCLMLVSLTVSLHRSLMRFQFGFDLLGARTMLVEQFVNVRLVQHIHLSAPLVKRLDMALAQMIHEPLNFTGSREAAMLHRQVMQTHETRVPMAKKPFRLDNRVVRRDLLNTTFSRCPGRLISPRRGAQAQRRPQHRRGEQNKLRDPHPQTLRSSKLQSTIDRAAPACIRRRVLGRAIFARPSGTCVTSESGPSESRRFVRRSWRLNEPTPSNPAAFASLTTTRRR